VKRREPLNERIGERTLREFLCGLHFDYFMNKAAKGWRVFDEDATKRSFKTEIFQALADGTIDRATAHEWRDELDDCYGDGSEHLFAERLMTCEFFYKLFSDYPSLVMRDCPQARAFWDGPWQALCTHWRQELNASRACAIGESPDGLSRQP